MQDLCEQVVKYHLGLDAVAVHVSLYTVCRYHRQMKRLPRLCLIPEDLYLVAKNFVIFAVDGELVDGVFHFTYIDYVVSSVNQQVYLGAAFTILSFTEPGRSLALNGVDSDALADLLQMMQAELLKCITCPTPAQG